MGFLRKPMAHGAKHGTAMAIYSFNHDTFGLTTNRPGAAGDNIRYNADLSKTQMDDFLKKNARYLEEHGVHRSDAQTEAHLSELRHGRSAAENAAYNAREEACYAVRSHIIPPGPNEAEAWFRAQEKGERKNARMSDRFIGALPRELTPEQCIEAVEQFCREVTRDRVPWHFALHLELDQRDQPDWNPHAHIIMRDRDIETGRRFLYTSAGPKERSKLLANGGQFWDTSAFRRKWNDVVNTALERAGHDVRVDHRSLKAQGIDRDPQIHIGPASQNATRKGYPFDSRDRQHAGRTIPYSLLDAGTRAEHNADIVEGNKDPANRQQRTWKEHPDQQKLREAQAKVRRGMYDEQKRDRDALRGAQNAQLDQHKGWAKTLYAGARKSAFEQVREQMADQWTAVRAIKDPAARDLAAGALKLEQKKLYAERSTHHVNQARAEKDQAWQALRHDQLTERLDLRAGHREEYTALTRQHVAERLGTGERIRAKSLQSAGNRLAARYSGYGSMAAQQGTAQRAIRLARKAKQHKGAMKPQQTALAIMSIATTEHDQRKQIRNRLNAQRHINQVRCPVPDRLSGEASRGAPGHVMESDRQSQARLAAQSGRPLSADERAALPQHVGERLDAQDRKASTENVLAFRHHQQRGRDRGGGGRGR
jgi:hypothetical protein